MNEALLILGMALVTYAVRYPPLALVGRAALPDNLLRALKFVPPVVLAAIVVPEMFLGGVDGAAFFQPDGKPERLIAGIVAGLVAWRTRNLLLTIVVGMAALWVGMALLPG